MYTTCTLNLVVYTYNPSTREEDYGFKSSLGYIARPCLEKILYIYLYICYIYIIYYIYNI
jgi:hypothetical protein